MSADDVTVAAAAAAVGVVVEADLVVNLDFRLDEENETTNPTFVSCWWFDGFLSSKLQVGW